MDWNDINIWALLAAVSSDLGLGALWYSPICFGKQWMELAGMNRSRRIRRTTAYGVSFVSSLTLALAMLILIRLSGISGSVQGGLTGLVAGVGIVAASSLKNYVFEDRPVSLFLIHAGYQILGLVIIGIILSVWH